MSDKNRLVTGARAVQELLQSQQSVLRVWISPRLEAKSRKDLESACRDRGVSVQRAPDARLASLCRHPDHQGVVAEVSQLGLMDLAGLLALPESVRKVVFVLDGVENPRNLGMVARTLAATGCGPIVLPSEGAALPGAAYLEASAGYGEMVPLVRATKLVTALEILKKDGYWVYGLDAQGERPLFGHELAAKTVFVLGNETKGMRNTVRKGLDQTLSIPIRAGVDSLNVAVTAALCAYEAVRAGRV